VKMSQDLWAAWAGVIQVFSGYFERVSTVRVPLHQRSEVLHALTSYHLVYHREGKRLQYYSLLRVALYRPHPYVQTITIIYTK
jgi:hypothetical protein